MLLNICHILLADGALLHMVLSFPCVARIYVELGYRWKGGMHKEYVLVRSLQIDIILFADFALIGFDMVHIYTELLTGCVNILVDRHVVSGMLPNGITLGKA